MIKRMGCLSYVPLGYGTPQVQYLMRSLAAHYGTVTPIGLISPRWNLHPPQDDAFPDFSICYFSREEEHRVALSSVVPELIRWIRGKGLLRIGIYGAGEHTRALRALWNRFDGPPITTLITSETPVECVVDGLPTVGVRSLSPGALDIVVLSSGLFEEDMAATIGQHRPEIPVVALYNPRLSRFGTDLKPPESLSPTAIARYRGSPVPRWIDAFKPDLLVCTHYTLLEAILDAKHRPEHIIYYALEFGGTDGNPVTQEIIDHHRELASRISLVLYPEPNRMRRYQEVVGFKEVTSKVIFNTRPAAISHQRPADERNGRVLIQGSLSAKLTYIDYLARRTAPEPAIDVFGFASDHDRAYGILRDSALGAKNGFSYGGLVSTQRLTDLRPFYSYVVVMWNPGSFDGRYACPNKFFEAITDGVPPIVAPHPQCKEIIEKYDCGILLRDWSFEAFEDGLKQAQDIYGTPRYRELVDNCRRAATELSWERQFESLVPLLPPRRNLQRQTSRRRLLLLDPTLRTEIGHHFQYAQHVLAGAANLGVETVAGISRDCEVDLAKADRIYPLYQHDFWGRDTSFREMPIAKDSSARFVDTTRRILDSEKLGSGDDIFIPNISDADLAALTTFIYRCQVAYRWHIIIRHDLPDNSSLRIESLRRLQTVGRGSSVFFYADTPELVEQHHGAAGVPFTLLPIPVTMAPARRSRRKPVHDGIHVVYLGDARAEKGYLSLPALVRSCADLVSNGWLKFIIQANGAPGDTACELATAELTSYSTGVHLIRRHLSVVEYEGMLGSADVVLALYDPQRYHRRSSHVVAEALCFGTPVLVRRGTAPAGMLPVDSPWLCDDVDQAAQALRMLVANPQRELTGARQLHRSLAEFHNGKRLAEILIHNTLDESSLSLRTGTLEERHV